MTFFVRVGGLELVTQKVGKGEEAEEIDVLKVTLKGLGEDKKTKAILFVDPNDAASYPLGERGEVEVGFRQQRLALEPKPSHAES